MFNYLARKRRVQLQKGIRRADEKKLNRRDRALRHETLEDRRLLTLLGVVPQHPTIDFDSGGTTAYNTASNAFSIHATPLEADMVDPVPGEFSPNESLFYFGTLDINIIVDESGSLVGGTPGDDLVLIGDLDVNFDLTLDYSSLDGPLLTGEIVAFGHQDSGGSTDQYDFEFQVTGGQLAGLYPNGRLAISMNSEHSSFIGDFNLPFTGGAKGQIGGIADEENPGIDIEKLVNGEDADFPEEAIEINPGDPVTFTYQVTNTGNVPYAYADVVLVDDSGTPGDLSDDLSTSDLVFVAASDVGGDGILSPGEQWLYEYNTTAENLFLDDCGCEVGIYENTAVVTVPGATDSDQAHYTNPSDAPPCIDYDSGGNVSYNAATDEFSIHATPLTTEAGGTFFSGSLTINAIVNGAGVLVGGVPGDDFVLVGDLDADGDFIVDYSGTLLTGEIISYLATDSGGTTDTYEFTFVVTGGLLASQYMGMGLKVETTSENSTFTGDYGVNFGGGAKGEICCFCLGEPGIDIEKLVNGEDADLPEEAIEVNPGDPVTFTYQVTNTGNVPYAYADVVVVDDSGTPGDLGDDVSTTSGDLVFVAASDVGGDGILSPGEQWLYEYTTTAESLFLDPDCCCDAGIYENIAVVNVPGATDSDQAHYTNPDAVPCIDYDSGGNVSYDASNDQFSIHATPLTTEAGGTFFSGSLTINAIVNAAGVLVGGVPGDDFVLVGDLDADGDFVTDYNGVLLTGEIVSYLATDSGGTTDTYEFTFVVTGGLLASQYMGMGLKVETTSENSTFTGDYGVNFGGGAKGEICCFCIDTASLSGHKYTDVTGDGLSGDDTPLAGVIINLYQDLNGNGLLEDAEDDVVYATDTTDASGEYSFANLIPGDYIVQEIVPMGYQATSPDTLAVTLAAGDLVTTGFDFANFEKGKITGTKFTDFTGDSFTIDDLGLGGITINLYAGTDTSGPIVASTSTAVDGTYSFNEVAIGTYFVQEVTPPGYTQTGGQSGYVITIGPGGLTSGGIAPGNDFDNFQLGRINGTKFTDITGDGISGDDTGLGGVTINLFVDLDNDGFLTGADGAAVNFTVTAGDGTYSFAPLTAGTYFVQETIPAGYQQTAPVPNYHTVVITSGTISDGNNFANFQKGHINGTKFTDITGNSFSGDDTGLGGITINLYSGTDASGPILASTVTAGDGTYSFNDLELGTYYVQEVTPVGYTQTGGNAGYVVTIGGTGVQSGGTSTGNDFDNFQHGNVTGTKFTDITGNSFSGDDTGLGGITINLYSGTDASGPIIASTVTAGDGTYSFNDLDLGTYYVQEVTPAGYTQTGGNAGYIVTIGGAGVQSGGTSTGNNFDNFQKGRITGTKFTDITGNSFSGDDTGLGGVTINLYSGTDASGPIIASTVTAGDGTYSFNDLDLGTYFVQEVLPAGYQQTGGNAGYVVTIGGGGVQSGGTSTGNNFDNFQKGRITGTKFTDITGNSFSGDDTGLGGVTIDLYSGSDASGPIIASTVTAGDGTYSFGDLATGTYFVQEVLPAGYQQTGGNSGYVVIIGAGGVQSGGTSTSNNFDNFKKGKITGTKFTDITGNSFSADDTSLGGVTINLYSGSDASGPIIASTVTAGDGTYSFGDLATGTYFVQEVLPAGYTQTGGNAGYVVTIGGSGVQSGGTSTGNNFDNFKKGSISGKKYTDITGNGITGDDTGLGGVTIQLFVDANNDGVLTAADGAAISSQNTAANGSFSFGNLGAGRYFVQEVIPAGYQQTAPVPDYYTVVINSGVDATGKDFANFKKGTITGKKFTDITGNSFSADDTGLGGVTINLYSGNNASGPIVATTVTAGDGTYSFGGLALGTYFVQEVLPAGYQQTGGNAGYVVTIGGSGVQSGGTSSGNNFDNFKKGKITGTKFTDITGNSFSADDTGLGGVTINLYSGNNASGPIVATTSTAADGTYSFGNLATGTYFVQEVLPAGYTQTGGNAGYVVTIGGSGVQSGGTSSGNNFDNFKKGSISGKKYTDITGNGITGDDTGLGGVTIQLFVDANNDGGLTAADGAAISSQNTAANGTYSFANLGPGRYFVLEVLPAGYQQTVPVPNLYTVVLTSGLNATGKDFANFKKGKITGIKYKDLTGNSFSADDTPLAGVTINLYSGSNASGPVIASAVTAADGTYSFSDLAIGTYFVQEVVPAGYAQTGGNAGYVVTVGGTGLASGGVATGKNFDNRLLVPGIDIEKTTTGPTNSNPTAPDYDNEDASNGAGVPILTPGSSVTWTYKVTNTGELPFTTSQIVITDDNGTPSNTADDKSTTNGQITFLSVQTGDADSLLEPGEVWLYKATGTVLDLSSSASPAVTFDFTGNTALDGTDGIVRTFTAGTVSVHTSAWSRNKTSGAFSAAYLGSYSGGLGVTDATDGTGANNQHTVDNVDTDNYVLFEFNQSVVIDAATLGYVVGDSDMTVWIGTMTDPYNTHLTLSSSVLSGLGFTEVNLGANGTRTADLNAGGISGNVLVIASKVGDADDYFKIQTLKTQKGDAYYENKAKVTVPGATDSDLSHYRNPVGVPGIDIKKLTNGQDANTEDTAAQISAGDTVTWTYEVKNTGTTSFTTSQVSVTDDNGTPGSTGDDFSPTRVTSSDVGNDGILSPGETWTYTASGIADDLTTAGGASTFDFSGNSALDGTDGNVRTFTAGGVSVKASAFSREKSTGTWQTGWLGSYSGGLGVTDRSEGTGSNNQHTVDNNSARDNYVLFEFDESVILDSAALGYIVTDSDMTVWIGNFPDPFNTHLTLSDAVLTSMGFTEVNLGGSSTRTADLNSGNFVGNVVVIAAKTGETNDYFKIDNLTVRKPELGIYKNIGKVTAGTVNDTDVSYYKNPECIDFTYVFAGNTATTGTKGNIRTFTQNNVSVNVSGSSRTTGGTWESAYVGLYSEGLGITDTSEDGNNGTHRMDNVGRVNYMLFEFSTMVEVDRAFLDSVVGDSDVTVWIGTVDNPFHNHLTLSDALAGMASYSANSDTESTGDRWADFNPNGVQGNVLVIAASVTDDTPDDQFKIAKLDVCAQAVKFFVVDPTSDKTYEYGTDGEALAKYSIGATSTNARGVATTAAGDKVWVVDGNKKVYVYDADGVSLGSWTANGLTTPEDITTNGTDIWVVDDGANKVFRYAGGSGTGANRISGSQNAASSFNLDGNNGDAKGIVTDGNFLWVVNDGASTDKVFKYNMSGGLVGSWTIDSNNSSPTGITIDPSDVSSIWIVDSTDDAVYRYNGATGRINGSQSSDHVFQLASSNGNPQGIADPPPSYGEIAVPTDVFAAASSLPRKALTGIQDRALASWQTNSAGERRSEVADDFADAVESFELKSLESFRPAVSSNVANASQNRDSQTASSEDESDFQWTGCVDAALEEVFA